ncbi:MAG: sigma-70 family RNA polymerase sigma factor [Planctomycetota bacterium]|nr:MAG: sigma-70 family RNA polymerase sigma factor [Planctomycetota bacterium]
MPIEDKTAIEQTLAGNQQAFAALVERYQSRLLGLLWHACGDRGLAEDIAQEAFIRAYRKLHTFAGDSQFYTWLAKIAMNQLISYRRRRRLESTQPRSGLDAALDTTGRDDPPDSGLELSETQQCVRAAIALLDEDRRTVLLLRDFDGHDYEAIARILDLPVGTVRSRLHRARLELKSILQSKSEQLGLE